MKRRTVVINAVLGLAVLGVGVAVAVTATSARRVPEPPGRTVAVSRGTVAATVTASGNVESATSVAVGMTGAGGTVTTIYVKEGERVEKGDRLLKVDDSAARQSLQTAQASLDSARAQLTTATQGRSAAEQQVDDDAVRSAETALANARTAKNQAKKSYELDSQQQNRLVDDAEDALDEAKKQRDDDEEALEEAEDALAEAQRTGNTAEASAQQSTITSLTSALEADETAVDNAETQLTQARQTRDKTLLPGRQAIETQSGQVDTAERSLASQRSQRAANQQPARQGSIDSAQAQIDSAEVGVDQAEQDLADTVLRAPVDGTVADIAAVVGQSSSTAGQATSTGTSTGSSGAGGGTGTGGNGSGAAAAGDTSSGGGGLVTLVNQKAKQVSASVAEADVTDVKLGQSVSVRFPASGRTLTGQVSAVATESTVVGNVVEYDVTIGFAKVPSAVRLGQTATATITTARRTDVLIAPTSAITVIDGRPTVTRRVNGTDSVVEIQTGLVGSAGTEVVRGLAVGDQVVLPTGNEGPQDYTFPDTRASASPSPSPSSPSASR